METKNTKETVKQILTEYLKIHGNRRTPERYAILDAIYSINGHFDMYELATCMTEKAKFRVSRATLYNTMDLLINAKLVIKHQFNGASQYEKSYNRDQHHHQICVQCGSIIESHNEELEKAITDVKLKNFTASHHSLYIYGVCAKCGRKNKRVHNTNNLTKTK
jgi:Fur family ferric uptake transcriptional regulator